jgi:hypothetical protein
MLRRSGAAIIDIEQENPASRPGFLVLALNAPVT